MDSETTRTQNNITSSNLYMAIELSNQQWKLGPTIGFGQPPRLRNLAARNLPGLCEEIDLAKARFGLADNTPVLSCYEAGRDGFWLHRYLVHQGVTNLIVDSASIEVNRRKGRAQTDRMGVGKLLTMLMRYAQGEKKVWSVVHIPTVEEEDQRQLHRELMAVTRERTKHINRLKGLLASQGVALKILKDFPEQLNRVKLWNATPLPAILHIRLLREYERLQLVEQQLHEIEESRSEALRTSHSPAVEQIRKLLQLQGIGLHSAWMFVMEFFAWRQFHNRRELGSLAGLTATPYQSGESAIEQGISKAGNRWIRAMAIEIAWSWLRYQPESQLSQWYQKRFAKGGGRLRRIGIVALARRLLIELWKYLETGILPQGACLKTN